MLGFGETCLLFGVVTLAIFSVAFLLSEDAAVA